MGQDHFTRSGVCKECSSEYPWKGLDEDGLCEQCSDKPGVWDDATKWSGVVDSVEDGTLYASLTAEGAGAITSFMEMPFERFYEMCPSEMNLTSEEAARPGLIFYMEVVGEDVVITMPPRWTEEEIERAKKEAAEISEGLRRLFARGEE